MKTILKTGASLYHLAIYGHHIAFEALTHELEIGTILAIVTYAVVAFDEGPKCWRKVIFAANSIPHLRKIVPIKTSLILLNIECWLRKLFK